MASASDVEQAVAIWLADWLPRPTGTDEGLQVVAIRQWHDRWGAVYRRTVGDVPVLGDEITVTLGTDGSVCATALRISEGAVVERICPSPVSALAAARSYLAANDILQESDRGEVLVPIVRDEQRLLVPSRQVEIRCEEPFGRWIVTVGSDGQILRCTDRIRHLSVAGAVRVTADDFSYCDGVSVLPAAWLELTLHTTTPMTATTAANGSFSFPVSETGELPLTAALQGPYVKVDWHNSTGDALLSANLRPGIWRLLSFDDTNSRPDERDAWVHVNRAHDFLIALDPDFTLMNVPVTAYVGRQDLNCPGDAWYDYGTLNFCAAAGGFANTATIGSVIYHEYCHAITDKLYGPLEPPGDVDEASSDFYSNLLTGESKIARGFWSYSCTNAVRDSDNDLVYPDDWTGHNHTSGQILAGMLWDAWQGLKLQMSEAEAKNLIAALWHGSRLLGLPMSLVEHVTWLFVVDDDNADLTDGTPHWDVLAAAARAHGFDPPPITYGIDIDHEPLADGLGDGDGFLITATITGDQEAIDPASPRLWYNSGSTWQDIPLTSTGDGTFAGIIPNGQCEDILCYYLTAGDVAGHVACLPPFAPEDVFCFQILGNVMAVADDMETDSGWTLGAPDDDAISGFWEWADPQLVEGSGIISQPEDDATPDPGHLCFVTGAAVGSGPGSYDVDGGKTSLISPSYDLSGLESAAVEFQAWIFSGYNTTDTEPLSLWVSSDGGQNWSSVFSEIALGGWAQYSITLGGVVPLTAQMRFKFVIQDPYPPALVEAAVDEFHIYGCVQLDSQPPKVAWLSPRGTQIIPVDSPVLVRWFASDNEEIADYSLLLSRDGGVTWPETIVWRQPYAASTIWTVTGAPTQHAKLKVQVRDGRGNTGEATSAELILVAASTSKAAAGLLSGLEEVGPNPFNPTTTIRYHLTAPATVGLEIYDLCGRSVRQLVHGHVPAGTHLVRWDGRSDAGDPVGSGTYLLVFRAGDTRQTRKLTLLK
jgi:hypothetical protein